MITQPWQRAFLGVSAILGEPLDASLSALDGTASSMELLQALRSPSRDVRARAIAGALAAVIAGLDEMRLG